MDAGKLLALVEPDLRSEDLPDVLDQLIALASDEDSGPWHLPSAPDGLIAASHVDLPAVTERIIEHLTSDDDWTREARQTPRGCCWPWTPRESSPSVRRLPRASAARIAATTAIRIRRPRPCGLWPRPGAASPN